LTNVAKSWTIDAYHAILDGSNPVRFTGRPFIYRCAPSWYWHSQPLTDYHLWCVLSGVGVFDTPKGPFDLHGGVCAIMPPGCKPRARHDPHHPLVVLGVHFDAEARPAGLQSVASLVVRDLAFLTTLCEHLETAGQSKGLEAALHSISLMRQILLLILVESARGPQSDTDSNISDLLTDIRRNPARHWSVEEMAGRVFLSRAQLTRRTKLAVGVGPIEYVIGIRLQRAEQLLVETDMSITEIARTLEYADVQFFSRQFKKRYGASPAHFRRMAFAPRP
jgi:AraC-like DNA-binding protein/quercetin dioxygenase-like cupin family protein